MSRLDYSFETNLESKNKDLQDPYLELLIFQLKNGNYLYVGCQGLNEYTLDDNVLSGTLRDLEFQICDSSLRSIDDDWKLADKSPDEFIQLLDSTVGLVGFKAGDDDLLKEHGYDDAFVPTAENASLQITVKDETVHYAVAKRLLDERELEAEIMQTIRR